MRYLVSMKYYSLFFCLSLGLHGVATALMPFVDEGRLVRSGHADFFVYSHAAFYRFSASSILNWDIVARLDQGLPKRRDLNKRYFLSMGRLGLQGGALIKWVPVKGYKKYWPAMGVNAGMTYHLEKFWQTSAYTNLKQHFLELTIHPFISKEFNTVIGPVIPYMTFPLLLKVQLATLQTDFILPAALGLRGELFFIYFHKFELNIEYGFALLASSPKYFSIGVFTRL